MAEAAPDATHRGEGVRYRQDTNTPSGLWRRPGSLWREPVRPDNEAMLRQTRGVGRVPGGQDGQRARSWRRFRPMRRVKTSTGFTCSSFGVAARLIGRSAPAAANPPPAGLARTASGSTAAGTRSAPYISCRNRVKPRGSASRPYGRPCVLISRPGGAAGRWTPRATSRPRWPARRPRSRRSVP